MIARLGRPPLRFVMLAIGGWAGARTAWLASQPAVPLPAAWHYPLGRAVSHRPDSPQPAAIPYRVLTPPAVRRAAVIASDRRIARGAPALPAADLAAPRLPAALAPEPSGIAPGLIAPGPIPTAPVRGVDADRLAASAWLFARSGSGGAALAPGGQLGGSQAGIRATAALVPGLAAAIRLSMPLHDRRGAEAAAGIDWRPLPALRVSIERRAALGSRARDAWSAYAAGGVYREVRGLVIDGYAQAGIVGTQRRDLFADGALRAGRRLTPGVTLGGGVWGAAQPGVARLDIGPRAALALPIANTSLALEGRIRIAGRAAPGSGIALTLASDF